MVYCALSLSILMKDSFGVNTRDSIKLLDLQGSNCLFLKVNSAFGIISFRCGLECVMTCPFSKMNLIKMFRNTFTLIIIATLLWYPY